MAAYQVLLLNTAVPQIQAAQAGDTYVVPRDIAFSAALTLSAGTANGVPYLNGSKVLTSGSALTFDGSQLGIGTGSPAARFNVESGDILLRGGQLTIGPTAGGNGAGAIRSTLNGVLGSLIFQTEDSNAALVDRMTLDSSGNLGLGVTPSAWGSGIQAMQVGSGAAIFDFGASNVVFGSNVYHDGTNNKYISTDYATYYQQNNGVHIWSTAPSGTAGNAISFTQVMTLDASGNLLLGETARAYLSRFTLSYDPSSTNGPIFLDNRAFGIDNGGALWLGGRYNSSNDYRPFGGIIASKENATDGNSAGYLTFHTNGNAADPTERARITSGGDFQTSSGNSVMVGGTAARATTAGTNRVDIFDGTAPVGTLANGVSFYSASGEANVMDAAGNATLLSPHDAVTNEWIFRSKHTPTGKVLKIDVERLLKFVNDHFGLDAVHEFIED